jgi:hypothetical protein
MRPLVLATALVSLAGCESTSAQLADLMQRSGGITTLAFTTSDNGQPRPPQVQKPPVNVLVTDAARAQAAYRATLQLPVWDHPGVYHCPISWGVTFNATFMQDGQMVQQATIEPDGCNQVKLLPSGIELQAFSDTYWGTLAQALGVPEDQLRQ